MIIEEGLDLLISSWSQKTLEVDGMINIIKNWIIQEWNMIFPWNKNILKLSETDIVRSYHFFSEGSL